MPEWVFDSPVITPSKKKQEDEWEFDAPVMAEPYKPKPSAIKELGKGIVEGLTSTPETIGTLAKIAGAEKVGGAIERAAGNVAKKNAIDESLQGSIVDNPELLKEPAWWTHNIGQVMGSIAGPVGAGGTAATVGKTVLKKVLKDKDTIAKATKYLGIGAAGGFGGAMEGSQTYNTVLQETGDKDKALRAGGLMAVGSAALNSLSFGTMLSKATKNKLAHVVMSGFTEGATEQLEEPLDAVVQGKPDQAVDRWIQGFNVFLPAMIVGGMGGGVGAVLNHRERKEVLDAIEQSSAQKVKTIEALALDPTDDYVTPEEHGVMSQWVKGMKDLNDADYMRVMQDVPGLEHINEQEALHEEAGGKKAYTNLTDRLATEEANQYFAEEQGNADVIRQAVPKAIQAESEILDQVKAEEDADYVKFWQSADLENLTDRDLIDNRARILESRPDVTPEKLNDIIIKKKAKKLDRGIITPLDVIKPDNQITPPVSPVAEPERATVPPVTRGATGEGVTQTAGRENASSSDILIRKYPEAQIGKVDGEYKVISNDQYTTLTDAPIEDIALLQDALSEIPRRTTEAQKRLWSKKLSDKDRKNLNDVVRGEESEYNHLLKRFGLHIEDLVKNPNILEEAKRAKRGIQEKAAVEPVAQKIPVAEKGKEPKLSIPTLTLDQVPETLESSGISKDIARKTAEHLQSVLDYEDVLLRGAGKVLDQQRMRSFTKKEIEDALSSVVNQSPDLAKQAESVRQGNVGDMLASGEVVLTSSGRQTTPFPKVNTGTNRAATNTLKNVDKWLQENALAEAELRGDEYNALQFRNSRKLSQADRDGMELYLFGEQPKVVPSILKDPRPSRSPVDGEQQSKMTVEPSLKTEPVSKESLPTENKSKPQAGYVFIKRAGREAQYPFTEYREITKGKDKGKIGVTVRGREFAVERSAVKQWPGEVDEQPRASRKENTAPLTSKDVIEALAPLHEKWKNHPDAIVVDSIDKLPKELLNRIEDTGSVQAVFDPKAEKIYYIADKIGSPEEAREVAVHETIKHWGLRKTLGPEFASFMDRVYGYASRSDMATLDKIAKNYGLDLSRAQDRFEAADEYVAHMAGLDTKPPMWNRLVSWVQNWLRKIGLPMGKERANQFIIDAVRASRAYVEEGGFGHETIAEGLRRMVAAFHGSPHTFDKFSKDKIGTGEGAQAYGHGMYFAGKKEVAEYYKDALSSGANYKYKGKIYTRNLKDPNYQVLSHIVRTGKEDTVETYEILAKHEDNVEKRNVYQKQLEFAKSVDEKAIEPYENKGHLYEVELAPDEGDYLLWDKPLSEQSEKVKAAIEQAQAARLENNYDAEKIREDFEENGPFGYSADRFDSALDEAVKYGGYGPKFGADVWVELEEAAPNSSGYIRGLKKASFKNTLDPTVDTGEIVYKGFASEKGGDRSASDYLHSLGIRGIKYLDGASRDKGEGDYNYVIFSDEDVNIKARYKRKEAEESPRKPLSQTRAGKFGKDVARAIQVRPVKILETEAPESSREPVAKYRQTIQDDRHMAAQWMADYEDAMTVTGKHLTHADKKWMQDHFKEFYEKQKEMPNERIQGFADKWTKIHNGIGDTARSLKVQEKYRTSEYVVKDGDRSVRVLDDKVSAEDFIRDHKRGDEFTIEVRDAIKFRPFTKIERYFPHILTPDAKEAMRTQSGEIFDALVQAAHTKGFDLTPYLEDLDIKNLVRRNANLEHARQANMPEYVTTKSGAKVQVLETDPFKVIPASIEGAARRLAFVKNWGPKSTESLATHEQYRNAIAGEAGSETAGTWDYLWQDMQGRTRDEFTEGMGSNLQKTFNTSEAIARSLMLSMAQVANIITGPVPIMVKYGAKRTAKAYAKLASRQLLTHFGVKMPDTEKALDDFRRMGGWAHDTQKVTGDTESLSQSLGGMADTFLKKTGMEAANRFLNKVSSFSAHGALIDALEGLKKPDNHGFKRMWGESHASLRSFLKREGEWTDADVDRMIKDGPSDNDVTRFVQRSSTMANVFMERAETRPQFMKNGFWRRVFAYTSYYRMMGSVVSDTMRYAKEGNYRPLMTLVLGAAVLGTAEREIKDYLKGIIKRDNGNSEELNFAGNLLDSLAGSGALAMPGTFINDVKWWTRKGDTPFTMPQIQWWGNVAHGMYNAVKKGLTEDAGAGANQAYYTTVRNVPLFRTIDNMTGGPYKKYLDYKYRNGGSGRRRRRRSR